MLSEREGAEEGGSRAPPLPLAHSRAQRALCNRHLPTYSSLQDKALGLTDRGPPHDPTVHRHCVGLVRVPPSTSESI